MCSQDLHTRVRQGLGPRRRFVISHRLFNRKRAASRGADVNAGSRSSLDAPPRRLASLRPTLDLDRISRNLSPARSSASTNRCTRSSTLTPYTIPAFRPAISLRSARNGSARSAHAAAQDRTCPSVDFGLMDRLARCATECAAATNARTLWTSLHATRIAQCSTSVAGNRAAESSSGASSSMCLAHQDRLVE